MGVLAKPKTRARHKQAHFANGAQKPAPSAGCWQRVGTYPFPIETRRHEGRLLIFVFRSLGAQFPVIDARAANKLADKIACQWIGIEFAMKFANSHSAFRTRVHIIDEIATELELGNGLPRRCIL
jgi:hypothetical protein